MSDSRCVNPSRIQYLKSQLGRNSKFTREDSNDNKLPLLDCLLHMEKNKTLTCLQKTDSYRTEYYFWLSPSNCSSLELFWIKLVPLGLRKIKLSHIKKFFFCVFFFFLTCGSLTICQISQQIRKTLPNWVVIKQNNDHRSKAIPNVAGEF